MRALLFLFLLSLLLGCGSAPLGGSLSEGARWLAPTDARFERELAPWSAGNPTPVTVTVVVQGGGGGEAIGQAVNTFAPGVGTLVAGVLGLGGAAVAGGAVSRRQLRPALRLAMRGLERAAPAARRWVRDHARDAGLSPLLESMIAGGELGAAESPAEERSTSVPSSPS